MIKEEYYKIGDLEMFYRYYDKNGNEIHMGDFIEYEGRDYKIYASEQGELCTDATNPEWIKSGRAFPCQYGLYPLTAIECNNCTIIKLNKDPNEVEYLEATITLTFSRSKESLLKDKYITMLIDSDDCIEYSIK